MPSIGMGDRQTMGGGGTGGRGDTTLAVRGWGRPAPDPPPEQTQQQQMQNYSMGPTSAEQQAQAYWNKNIQNPGYDAEMMKQMRNRAAVQAGTANMQEPGGALQASLAKAENMMAAQGITGAARQSILANMMMQSQGQLGQTLAGIDISNAQTEQAGRMALTGMGTQMAGTLGGLENQRQQLAHQQYLDSLAKQYYDQQYADMMSRQNTAWDEYGNQGGMQRTPNTMAMGQMPQHLGGFGAGGLG